MGEAIGTTTIDLEWVQVHPTGLVTMLLKSSSLHQKRSAEVATCWSEANVGPETVYDDPHK